MIIGVNKLAKELMVSRETLYRYMKAGMPYYQINCKRRAFDLKEVSDWLKNREV